MYARFDEGSSDKEKVTGKCFVSTGADKYPMTSKVCILLESFNIPSSSYLNVLSNFNDTLFLC